MMTESQINKCRGNGFLLNLQFVKRDGVHNFYICPWCGPNCGHYAMMRLEGTHDARPVHCYATGNMGWLMTESVISSELSKEEHKFRALLNKWKGIEPMTAKEACIAWHTHGCPEEIAEDLSTDPTAFRELVADHKALGGNQFRQVFA